MKGTFKWTLLFWISASFVGAGFVYSFLSMFSVSSLAWAIPVTVSLIALAVGMVFLVKALNKKNFKWERQ